MHKSSIYTQYPPINQIGPTPKPAWIAQYLTNNPSIPDIPVLNQTALHPDWQDDFTQCDNASSWALTYDDGPGPYTQTLLNNLKRADVKVTFFVVGSRLREGKKQAQTLQNAYRAGHQIGIHTWSHHPITLLTNEQLLGEILWTGKIIQDVIGVFPTYFRPPLGDIDERTRAVIKSVGLKIVIWNQDSADWYFSTIPPQKNFTEDQEIARFNSWIANPPSGLGPLNASSTAITPIGTNSSETPGIISIQHDLFPRSANMTSPTMELVLQAGYNVMPVASCIGDTEPWYRHFNDTPASVTIASRATIAPAVLEVKANASSVAHGIVATASVQTSVEASSQASVGGAEKGYGGWRVMVAVPTTANATAPPTNHVIRAIASSLSLSHMQRIAAHIRTQSFPPAEPTPQNRKRRRRAPKNNQNYATGFTQWREHDDVEEEEEGEEEERPVEDLMTVEDPVEDSANEGVEDESRDDAPPASHALVLRGGDDIAMWQYTQEHAIALHFPASDSADPTAQNEQTEPLQLAIAHMWEPHRDWYSSYGWWTWDQFEHEPVVMDERDGERPSKLMRLGTDADPFSSGAASPETASVAAPEEFEVGTSFAITELFSLANSAKKSRHGNEEVVGMEVEKDAVYDESELTPEEIEIQRWSVAWKAQRAIEMQHEESLKLQLKNIAQQQELLHSETALHQQTYAYKSQAYPSLYGGAEAAELIISLEAEVQRLFELSGGVGSVPAVIPKGEKGKEYYGKLKEPKMLIKASDMVRKEEKVVVVQPQGAEELEEGEEGEEGELMEDGELEEEGEISDDGAVESTRVLWPVLPLRS
ncbi:chitin deacetylase [Podochytrium sp. JEL0797]|nr:chitin deacetylase [Podochytrium sp. JEL0797]